MPLRVFIKLIICEKKNQFKMLKIHNNLQYFDLKTVTLI